MDSLDPEQRQTSLKEEIERLKSIGLEPEVIDLRDYFQNQSAPDQTLAKKLAGYDLIWVRGGNVFILQRAFKYSGADQAIKQLLETDKIVYGGYSAGIDVLTPTLKGIELVDDPYQIPDQYNSEIIWDCLGLLTYSVAPHYKSDHPESADIDKSVQYFIDNHMTFIALRDGEAMVIDGDSQTIVG